MGIKRGPTLVRDGLVLHLDAANIRSYPGSGTTWFDLSGNNYHFNLINGNVYTSEARGALQQDGSNDYFERAYTEALAFNGNTSFSIHVAARNIDVKGNYAALTSYGDQDGTYGGWQVLMYDDGNIYGGPYGNIAFYRFDPGVTSGGVEYDFTSVADANSTNYWVFDYSSSSGYKMYRNGAVIASSGATHNSSRGTNLPIRIGTRGGNIARITQSVFYSYLIYNRSLTASEILQNYTAQKSRFGL